MLDRLISGAGAVTDAADRLVRLLAGGLRGGLAATRPGSVVVATLLLVLAGILVAAGLEVTDPSAPVALDPSVVSTARDLGDRTYSTLTGSLSTTWLETFQDGNGNGIEDGGETGDAWYYWLVDPVDRRGVTVRSTRSPAHIFTYRARGILIADPNDRTEAYAPFQEEIARAGIHVDADTILDTTRATGTTRALDLAGPLPASGTAVELTGSRTGAYVAVCSRDDDHDGVCDPGEAHGYEMVVFDQLTKHGIRVLVDEPPEFSQATVTGLLRREERAIDDATDSQGFDIADYDLHVSDRYLLDEAVPPGSAPLAYVLALLCVAAAGTILVGLAGGYLIYRRSEGRLPDPVTTLCAGERLPLRITGIVRTPTGRERVREAPGELVRFAFGRPVSTVPAPAQPAGAAEPGASAAPLVDEPVTTTLLVERFGHPQGVALGLGELRRVSAGRVMAFRGPRPALRVVAGTGPLVLSFDTEAERDRAVSELLDETGLGPDGKTVPTP